MIDARAAGNEELLSRLIGEKWSNDEIRGDKNLPISDDKCGNDIRHPEQLRDEKTIESHMENRQDNDEHKDYDAVFIRPPTKKYDKLD